MQPGHSLKLPLVAYRGLWDRCAPPESFGAIRRAYLRGIPSLLRLARNHAQLADAIALTANPVINHDRQPLYLITSYLPPTDVLPERSGHSAPIFAMIEGRSTRVWPVWKWTGVRWTPAGSYVPVKLAAKGFSAADFDTMTAPSLVLVESCNVVADVADQGRIADLRDDQVITAVRTVLGPRPNLLRVSDLVELDQLELRAREAA